MSFKITNKRALKIYLKDKDYPSINHALSSFERDLSTLFIKPIIVNDNKDADIEIFIKPLNHDEEYCYEILDKKILIYGNDDLGVIYSLYSFLQDELNVPPFYLIQGLDLINKDEIVLENKIVNSYPETKFRGQFINDEDLLGSFKANKHREINDYPFYHDIINTDIMKMVCETILRYRNNLIIPSTLINILNPDEAELVDIASSYGLYISQHHIEPLGVSKYGFNMFCKDKGFDNEFSYINNHEAMVEAYKEFVKRWSKYPRVIFQLGLRGVGDRPFWNKEDKSDDEYKGRMISKAINEQYEIVNQYYPYEKHFTSTLWMEGADLLKKGYIDIKKDITLVFSDVGMSSLFGDDFFITPREEDRNYGIYYHLAYWHTGAHLIEGVPPQKIEYCFNLAKEKQNPYYSIINSANIKEMVYSLFIVSNLMWDSNNDYLDLTNKYGHLYLQNGDINNLFKRAIELYYFSLKDVGEEYYDYFCHKYNFSYHKYENLPFPVINMNDGMYKAIMYCFYYEDREKLRKPILRKAADEGYNSMIRANELFKEINKLLHPNYRVGFSSHFLFQSEMMIRYLKSASLFYDACEKASKKEFETAKELYQQSNDELKKIIALYDQYFVEYFEGYMNYDKKIDIKFLSERILQDYDRALEKVK